MGKKVDLTGQTIKDFKILEEIPSIYPGGRPHTLVRGLCLLCNKEATRDKGSVLRFPHFCTKQRYVGQMSGFKWRVIQQSAKRRKIPFDLTAEYVWKLYESQKGKCALSGVDMYFGKDHKEIRQKKETASLDRIDGTKGYIKGNVQWVHKAVNQMKMCLDEASFIEWCKLIAKKWA